MNDIPRSKIVYDNLFNGFFKYRHVVPVTKKLSDEEFYNQMNRQKYVFIITKIDEEFNKNEYDYLHIKPIYIVLLSELNENSSRTSFLLGLKEKIKKIGKDKNPEIIFIVDKDTSSALGDVLRKHNIYMYHYVKFAIIFPECSQADEHRIMTPSEVEEFTHRLRLTTKNKLNKILKDDTMVIWIGAKVDDLIEIKRISETTIYSYEYRLVKNKTLTSE